MTDKKVPITFCAVMFDFVRVHLKVTCARFKGEKKAARRPLAGQHPRLYQ
jgi:hypothetical protein